VIDSTISSNGQHIFFTIPRHIHELNSSERYEKICDTLKNDPDNKFLDGYYDNCLINKPIKIDLNQFIQYSSSCFGLSRHCPSLKEIIVNSIPQGYYTKRPYLLSKCEPGFFCQNGLSIECPIGYKCPFELMEKPLKCEASKFFNTTCFGNRHVNEKICPYGNVCYKPYYPPIPSPPGFFGIITKKNSRSFSSCIKGEYCNLVFF
jgi:hypothetical protein